VNLPVVKEEVALRLVGYHGYDGGYIDNPDLGLRAINGSATDGGRAALRVTPGGGWTIDLNGLAQRIATADPQYALRGDGPLSLSAALRQPYRDGIALGSLEVRHKDVDGPGFLATLGGVRRVTTLRYDASRSPAAGPIAYDEHTASSLIDGEMRLWRTSPSGGGWLLGVSAVQNWTAARRQLGPPKAQRDISGVDNRSLDLAAFGEGTVALAPGLTMTLGGRLTHARIDGQPLAARRLSPFIRGQGRTRFDPTAALSAQIAPGLALYGRYARGFRAGGLAVAAGAGRVAVYRPDSLVVLEAGLRADRLWGGRLSGTIGVSRAWWKNVQADLVARNGFPFTANIGDGRISAIEARLTARPMSRLSIEADGLFTHSDIVHPAPGYEREGGNDLPDTPKTSVATTIAWAPPIDAAKRFWISATARYQGRSRFGAGPLFGIDQSGYATGDLTATLLHGAWRGQVSIENLPDTRGNRFAVGNPFQLRMAEQYTPLRPRTVRFTLTWTG
jgi:iron complex outermembrane recepter protein